MKKTVRAPKEEVVNVRLTAQQKASFEAVAAGEGLGLSTWMLRVCIMAERASIGAR